MPSLRHLHSDRTQLLFLTMSLLLLHAVWVEVVRAQTAQREFNIPPQALSSALKAYADSTNLQLLYPSEIAHGLRSNGVVGKHTPQEALNMLLQGTGLSFRFVDDKTVTVSNAENSSQQTPQSVVIEETQVIAERERERRYTAEDTTTATKTDTPIFDLPVSIQVVPRGVIEDQQVIRLQDALKNVSGVYQTLNSGISELTYGVRGFDQDTLYEDGFRLPFSPSQETAHLERVEVLKGPASVLYGRIEPGGLINLVTKRPLATPYYSLRQQIGSFDFYRTTADVTGPITTDHTLLYRFNFAYENAGSFRDFINTERVFASPVLTWNLGPRTQVSLDYQYQYQDKPRDRGIPVVNGRPADVPISRFFQEPVLTKGILDYHRPGMEWSHQFTESWRLQHRFKASFNHTHEIGVDGLSLQPDNQTLSRSASDFRRDDETYFTVLDLTGKFSTWGITHTLLLGADYYNTSVAFNYSFASVPDIDIFNPVYSGMKPVFLVEPDYFQDEEWYGVYLQDQIDLRDNLHLLVGGRYDNARFEFDARDAFESFAKAHDTDFTPRVGIVYQPLHWLSLYGSYVESFGGSNAFSVSRDGEALDPETATQYEVGLKTNLLDGKLFATLAFYELTKENIAQTDPLNPAFSILTGEARSRGIEWDVSGEITPSLSLIASYAYTDTKITQDNSGNEGNRLLNAPRHSGSVWGVYSFAQGPLQGLKLGAGVFAVGEREGNNENTFQLPDYVRVDLLAAYEWSLGSSTLTAQLNIENLADEEYFNPAAPFQAFVAPGAPRTFIGSLRIEF